MITGAQWWILFFCCSFILFFFGGGGLILTSFLHITCTVLSLNDIDYKCRLFMLQLMDTLLLNNTMFELSTPLTYTVHIVTSCKVIQNNLLAIKSAKYIITQQGQGTCMDLQCTCTCNMKVHGTCKQQPTPCNSKQGIKCLLQHASNIEKNINDENVFHRDLYALQLRLNWDLKLGPPRLHCVQSPTLPLSKHRWSLSPCRGGHVVCFHIWARKGNAAMDV